MEVNSYNDITMKPVEKAGGMIRSNKNHNARLKSKGPRTLPY